MSPIEKHLQALLELSPDSCPVCLEDTPLTEKEMHSLAAQGLIQKHDRPDCGWWVNPTDDGLLYFIRKKESRRAVLLKMLASFASGVASALIVEHHMELFRFFVSLFRG
mgnify:CR=1 FL=1